MRDMAEQQRAKALKEWRRPIDEKVGMETARSRAMQGKYPVGSWHAWALDTVYGPPGSAKEAAE